MLSTLFILLIKVLFTVYSIYVARKVFIYHARHFYNDKLVCKLHYIDKRIPITDNDPVLELEAMKGGHAHYNRYPMMHIKEYKCDTVTLKFDKDKREIYYYYNNYYIKKESFSSIIKDIIKINLNSEYIKQLEKNPLLENAVDSIDIVHQEIITKNDQTPKNLNVKNEDIKDLAVKVNKWKVKKSDSSNSEQVLIKIHDISNKVNVEYNRTEKKTNKWKVNKTDND